VSDEESALVSAQEWEALELAPAQELAAELAWEALPARP